MSRLEYNWKLGVPRNVKIVQGNAMTIPHHDADSFAYRYLSFSEVETKTFDYDLGSAAEENKINPEDTDQEGNFFTLRKIMQGKSELLWVHHIGHHNVPPWPEGTVPSSISEGGTYYIDQPFSAEDYESVLKRQPTCMMTKNKSLMPMILPPSKNYIGYLNGVYMGQNQSITAMLAPSQGYNWEAAAIGVTNPFGADDPGTESYQHALKNDRQRELAGMITTYGWRTAWGCLTNGNSFMNDLDGEGICNRMYKLNLAHALNGNGAFALVLSIDQKSSVGEGLDSVHKSMGAMVLMRIAGVVFSSSQPKDGQPVEVTRKDYPNSEITMRYAPDSQLTMMMGRSMEQGGFTEPGDDLVPPFCQRTPEGNWNGAPMIFYPSYAGIVVTNSVIKNARGGNDSILLPAQRRGDVKNDIRITGHGLPKADKGNSGRPGDADSSGMEIAKHIAMEDGEQMKWFPTLVQEASDPLDIGVRIVPKEPYVIGSVMYLRFIKCLGNFGYCPMYFYRLMAFTLFFKGNYVNPENYDNVNDTGNAGKFDYFIYPFVCDNTTGADENDDVNTNGWNAGMCKLTSKRGAVPFKVKGYSNSDRKRQDINGLVCQDDTLEEAIYRADFEYKSNVLQRYPIEVFGCAIATKRPGKFQFDILNDNGNFSLDAKTGNFLSDGNAPVFSYLSSHRQGDRFGGVLDLITNLSVQVGLDGVSGSMTLDAFPMEQGLDSVLQSQTIGEIDLDVSYEGQGGQEDHVEHGGTLFKGFGMELSTSDSEGNYQISVNLEGMQRKLSDMKLACAPFWDGDRLEAICAYFESYCKVSLRMFSKKTSDLDNGQGVSTSTVNSHRGTWIASDQRLVNKKKVNSNDFRVPRSVDWKSPAVNFENGKSCYDALKDLAGMTGCIFTVGLDGRGYFYERNHYGFPYYVHNCMKRGKILHIDPKNIISINLSPFINNKYNTIFTFGFLQKKKPDGMPDDNILQASVAPGVYQTIITRSSMNQAGLRGHIVFPWSKTIITTENGYLTPSELLSLHKLNVFAACADAYQGSVTVPGNTMIQHVYEVVEILGERFFVVSIDHQIDAGTKMWTTSYQLNYYDYELMDRAAASDPDHFEW